MSSVSHKPAWHLATNSEDVASGTSRWAYQLCRNPYTCAVAVLECAQPGTFELTCLGQVLPIVFLNPLEQVITHGR